MPAAPLKPLIIRHAEQRGLVFPPEGYNYLKFIDFLDLFPLVIKIRRRSGQDAFVAKAEHAELLDELQPDGARRARVDRGRVALRSDVFDALAERKHFANGLGETDQKSGLFDALNDAAAPLRAFSQFSYPRYTARGGLWSTNCVSPPTRRSLMASCARVSANGWRRRWIFATA